MQERESKRQESADAEGWPQDDFSADLGHGNDLVEHGDATEETRLLEHHESVPAALEADGDGWLSTTRLRGATWLRAGIVNYLTT